LRVQRWRSSHKARNFSTADRWRDSLEGLVIRVNPDSTETHPMHIAIWLITAFFFGLWTVLAWGVATVLGIDPNWVGDLKPLFAKLPFGGLLETWIPNWLAYVNTGIELTRVVLGWLGSTGTWLVWAVWGVGTFLLLTVAAILSLVVASVAKLPVAGKRSASA